MAANHETTRHSATCWKNTALPMKCLPPIQTYLWSAFRSKKTIYRKYRGQSDLLNYTTGMKSTKFRWQQTLQGQTTQFLQEINFKGKKEREWKGACSLKKKTYQKTIMWKHDLNSNFFKKSFKKCHDAYEIVGNLNIAWISDYVKELFWGFEKVLRVC